MTAHSPGGSTQSFEFRSPWRCIDCTTLRCSLPGQQEALIEAAASTGVPVIVVLIHGGALSIDWTREHIPAILDAHYPGEFGGDVSIFAGLALREKVLLRAPCLCCG
jgi:hypothetical protein